MIIKLILSILSAYRLSRMIVGEDGPFNLFLKLRGFVMARTNPDSALYNGINCPLCVSFWIAAPIALYTAESLPDFFIHWLGIAGAVVLIYRNYEQ